MNNIKVDDMLQKEFGAEGFQEFSEEINNCTSHIKFINLLKKNNIRLTNIILTVNKNGQDYHLRKKVNLF